MPAASREGLITALRQLLLLRHAKSLWDDPKLSDHARPLNARGRASGRAMRQAMRDLGLAPDLVLVSSARRTLQTLETLAPWDQLPLVEPMDALYLASARSMLDVLHEVVDSVRSVLLIGHNPGLHELAMILIGAQAFTQSALTGQGGRIGWLNFYLSALGVAVTIPSLGLMLAGNAAAEKGATLGSILALLGMLVFAYGVLTSWRTAKA